MGRYRTIEVSDPITEGDGLRLLTFKSPALGGRGDATLFVPTGGEVGEDLPLVLLLHGVYGSHWAWSLKGGAHRTALGLIGQKMIRPVVIAMPSDGLWGDGTGYLPHRSADYESWIVEDVVGCVTELLPCLGARSKLFIAGLSMGGYGALRLGAKYAPKFSGVSGHSSMTHHGQLTRFVEEPIASYRVASEEEELGVLYWMKKNREGLPPIRFDCGVDDDLIEENRRLHRDLTAEKIPHHYSEFEGDHTWEYWRTHLRDTLLFFEGQCAGEREQRSGKIAMTKTMHENTETQLALIGGRPALAEEPPAWPRFDQADRDALDEVLESRVWGGYHPKVSELERRFAESHGAAYGVALANGTVSLEIALQAAGVGPGDEVIVPPVTFVASATSILRVGAVPVFADLDPQTLNLHPERVVEAVSERTRAVVAVHFAGHPVDLDALKELCAQKGLKLIEDCAHAHGAEWRGRRVGSFGQFGSFSFQASKNMTAGEGGILVTNDAELAERARSISNQGRRTGGAWYEHVRLGTNARLTGFQAALLLNQLGRLTREVETRMARAARLSAGLADIGGLTPTPESPDPRVTAHSYHLFSMRYDERAFSGLSRERFVEALNAEGVPASTGYPHPLYRNELFKNHWHIVKPCPVAEEVCGSWVWLPHNVLLADEAWIDGVLTAVRKIHGGVGALLGAV